MLHREETIFCPFHSLGHSVAPRLLPIESGYRILSLEGGGIKGYVQLLILKRIEELCFHIPTAHLYDFIIGTSTGGQLALALTTPGTCTPFPMDDAIAFFRLYASAAFSPRSWILRLVGKLFGASRYDTKPLENLLQTFFGKDSKVFPTSTLASERAAIPNVAVTTVSQEKLDVHLVAN
jgi:hypothetical protein